VAMLRNPVAGDDPPPAMFSDAPGETMRPPGVYPGLTRGEYEAIAALNFSILGLFATPSTPAHARYRWLHPPEGSAAQELGARVHLAVLEPQRFRSAFIPAPKIDRRTTEGKAAWKALEAQLTPGVSLIAEADWRQVQAMAEAVYAHPTAAQLMGGVGLNELSIVWEHPDEGQRCKARLDRVSAFGGYPFVTELKTCARASDREFARACFDYGYHRQLAWYVDGLEILKPAGRRAAIVAVENTPPYCVRAFELQDRALEQGRRENAESLVLYGACFRSNTWPGYPADLTLLDLPAWAVDRLD